MTVDLIAYTQRVNASWEKNPLDIVEEAASICYDSSMTDDYKIAKGCKASGHYSVLEHISFTFYVGDVSRALLAQISRHRHISLSVRSQRYCSESNFDYDNPFIGEDGEVLTR
ncbi:MAG: FAD-dependent thymidylate synthase [Streptococcus sp.]